MTDKPQFSQSKVALYVTCLANSLRPEIAMASVELLESLGIDVVVPQDQTCCGQPSYNGGHREDALAIAKHQISILYQYDSVVFPSGSCCGMIKNHYPILLSQDATWSVKAAELGEKCFDLSEYLFRNGWVPANKHPEADQSWGYHTSCSILRETRSQQFARELLSSCGLMLKELPDNEVCCGFGGAFSAKFGDISHRMGENKLSTLSQNNIVNLVSSDLGCLLHLSSLSTSLNSRVEYKHVAEVLNACNQK